VQSFVAFVNKLRTNLVTRFLAVVLNSMRVENIITSTMAPQISLDGRYRIKNIYNFPPLLLFNSTYDASIKTF